MPQASVRSWFAVDQREEAEVMTVDRAPAK
jgi:hypothetical protein